MVYLLNLLLVFLYYTIFDLIYKNNKHKSRKCFAVIVCIHAICFRALLDPYILPDNAVYANNFENIKQFSLYQIWFSDYYKADWGRGYQMVNWLIGRFTSSCDLFFPCMALIALPPIIYFYSKTSSFVLFSVVLFLIHNMMYSQGMYVLRQHFGISIMLLSLLYIDKLKISLLLVLFAISCHTGLFVLLPFYFFCKSNLSKLNLIRLVPIFLLGLFLAQFALFEIVASDERYGYLATEEEGRNNILPVFTLGLTCFSLYVTQTTRNIKDNVIMNSICNFMYYGFMIALFSIGRPGMGRLTLPFIYVMPVALTLPITYAIKYKNVAYVIMAIVVLLTIYVINPDRYSIYVLNVALLGSL